MIRLYFINQFGYYQNQIIQFFLYYRPNNFIINTKIFMNDSVSETSDSVPFYLLVPGPEFSVDSVSGFTDDFKVSNNCINGL